MAIQIDAIYEHGVLRPLEPLQLTENEQVVLKVTRTSEAEDERTAFELDYLETVRKRVELAGPAPGWEEVRRRLAKIPGSLSEDIIAEREDRLK